MPDIPSECKLTECEGKPMCPRCRAQRGLEDPPESGTLQLPNGCTLYWGTDAATGAREYASDEVGGGVAVWHTALVDPSTLLAAMVQEETFRRREAEIARRSAA